MRRPRRAILAFVEPNPWQSGAGPGFSAFRWGSMTQFQTKRVYDDAMESDGFRVLVDRVWPRGVSKERARVDRWLQSVAPSGGLRKWFDHDPEKWEEFKRRYFTELDLSPAGLEELIALTRKGLQRVTLVYSARDRQHNQAVALQEYLAERLASNR